ncbi:hypothetical protein AKJ09_03270 [Labilithrix luteola]|uniref:Intracellular proteinase inhibitor BsuPI domain-containing protein n=1 Tax=Labilithrix luteola TaxID=1391654 RepID=A0A0K1PT93_9BACT|nr:hypothetical protein [Labilithrix luteola]AKU96606.1 hypothetical protein AKJ09_03270 [Labilithrix luteola]
MVPIAEACRGELLTLDAELSACACNESEYRVYDGGLSVRAGQSCGLPHPNEKSRPKIEVTADRAELASGEDTVVIVRVTNSGPEAAVYRVVNRHLWTRLVQSNGQPFPDAVHASGPYNDEAFFELAPSGTMELRLPASASYDRWVGSGPSAKPERAKMSPGPYAIEVFLGELGGERTRLVPIHVR